MLSSFTAPFALHMHSFHGGRQQPRICLPKPINPCFRLPGFGSLARHLSKQLSPPLPRHLTLASGMAMDDALGLAVEDEEEESSLESYMQHVRICNRGSEKRSEFIPFVVESATVGFIHPCFVQHLERFPKVFTVGKNCINLHHSLIIREERTKAVDGALKVLNQEGFIPGWRNEFYPVVEAFGTLPLLGIERAAVPYFGTKAYGVHMNGYVINANGEKYLWTAKRSVTKQTYPGMFDHLVAGGQPEGLSPKENLIKECEEEANIPRYIAEKAIAVGAVSYEDIDLDRFKRDVLFCYDLELPLDFRPCNKDGEVESFSLVPVAQVAQIIRRTRLYKPNCTLVIIDFLFRHGYITPEDIGYLQLLQSLRKGECF